MSRLHTLARARLGLALLCTAALTACGGSTDLAGVGTGGTGSPTLAGVGSGGTGSGPAPVVPPPTAADGTGTGGTGRPVTSDAGSRDGSVPVVSKSLVSGSITEDGAFVVDGVMLDPSSASVVDALGRQRAHADLQRGRVVEVEALVDERTAMGVAKSVRLISEATGPVDSVDLRGNVFRVLGVPVRVTADTAWSAGAGMGVLAGGASVEVWGFRDDDGNMIASRVDVVQRASSRDPVTLRGDVAEVGAGGTTVRVAGQLVDLARLPASAPRPTAGSTVQIVGTQAAPGQPLVATSIEIIRRAIDETVVTAHLTGLVTRFRSVSSFELAGVPVDAGDAGWVGGRASMLRGGVRVTVTGPVRNGRVVARWVSFVAVPFVPATTPSPERVDVPQGAPGPASAPAAPGTPSAAKPGNTGTGSVTATPSPTSGGVPSKGGTSAASGGSASTSASAPLTFLSDGVRYELGLPARDWQVVRVEKSGGKTPVAVIAHQRRPSLVMRVHPVRTLPR